MSIVTRRVKVSNFIAKRHILDRMYPYNDFPKTCSMVMNVIRLHPGPAPKPVRSTQTCILAPPPNFFGAWPNDLGAGF